MDSGNNPEKLNLRTEPNNSNSFSSVNQTFFQKVFKPTDIDTVQRQYKTNSNRKNSKNTFDQFTNETPKTDDKRYNTLYDAFNLMIDTEEAKKKKAQSSEAIKQATEKEMKEREKLLASTCHGGKCGVAGGYGNQVEYFDNIKKKDTVREWTKLYQANKYSLDRLCQTRRNITKYDWLSFFSNNKIAYDSEQPLDYVYKEIDRVRITEEGGWRNLEGDTTNNFDDKLDVFFTRNYAENLEVYRKTQDIQ